MQEARIVIGANFGDEGKGLMTDVFAREFMEKYGRCLVACTNGGSQKGHTVVDGRGRRHVFHHFGSGALNGADTYLSRYFIVNPIIFNKEYEELLSKGVCTRTYIDEECLVTLPTDMMINQLIEEVRGKKKHGSCGFGIFETLFRNAKFGPKHEERIVEKTEVPCLRIKVKDMIEGITKGNFMEMFKTLPDYIRYRLRFLEIKKDKLDIRWQEIIEDMEAEVTDIIEAFYDDLKLMLQRVNVTDERVLKGYEGVVFEAAQGLLLDQNNVEYMPFLTPSNTGVKNPAEIIDRYQTRNIGGEEEASLRNIKVCYVTRSYMTRHGAGRFDEECPKEEINKDMYDMTNVPNPFQDTLRYGRLEVNALFERVKRDLNDIEDTLPLIGEKVSVIRCLAVTHLNEYALDMNDVRNQFEGFEIVEKYTES